MGQDGKQYFKKIENKSDLFVYTRTLEKIKKFYFRSNRLHFDKRNNNFSRGSLTCLPNVETSRQLFMGDDGIFEHANSKQVLWITVLLM